MTKLIQLSCEIIALVCVILPCSWLL